MPTVQQVLTGCSVLFSLVAIILLVLGRDTLTDIIQGADILVGCDDCTENGEDGGNWGQEFTVRSDLLLNETARTRLYFHHESFINETVVYGHEEIESDSDDNDGAACALLTSQTGLDLINALAPLLDSSAIGFAINCEVQFPALGDKVDDWLETNDKGKVTGERREPPQVPTRQADDEDKTYFHLMSTNSDRFQENDEFQDLFTSVNITSVEGVTLAVYKAVSPEDSITSRKSPNLWFVVLGVLFLIGGVGCGILAALWYKVCGGSDVEVDDTGSEE